MKNIYLIASLILGVLISCEPIEKPVIDTLAGQPGDPRFNLQFSNSTKVDLDLYVQTPNGQIIYWNNPFASNGSLDVDCECGGCPNGGNENIFWNPGTAPRGTYKYWVEFYESCSGGSQNSSFTLRVVKNNQILATQTGTISSGKSQVWSHVQ